MKLYLFIGLSAIFLFAGCKKATERACFKSKGNYSTQTIYLNGDINSLYLYDDLYYSIVPSNENKIVVKGGENLINFVSINEENKTVTITNENKCKFLRSLSNEIHVTLFVQSLTFIKYLGSRELFNTDTLISPELRLIVTDGAGDVNLTVKNGYMSGVITYGYGNFTLNGTTSQAFINCRGNSYCNITNLNVINNLTVHSETQNDMIVNADSVKLNAIITTEGNIKYYGKPTEVEVVRSGGGDLIALD